VANGGPRLARTLRCVRDSTISAEQLQSEPRCERTPRVVAELLEAMGERGEGKGPRRLDNAKRDRIDRLMVRRVLADIKEALFSGVGRKGWTWHRVTDGC